MNAVPLPVADGTAQPARGNVLHWVLLACVCHMLLWGSALTATHAAPALDSAEQLAWAYSLEAGYWKHPPLPTWILHGLITVFGTSVWLPFFAAQACVAIALGLTWRLGCEFMSPERSLLAMLLTSLVTYHHVGADAYNHSTVLLPFQAATLLAFYRATREGRWWQWGLAGVLGGLMLLVKYVAALQLLAMALYVATDRRLWTRRHFAGMGLATALGLLVFLPHFLWLRANDFWPLRYAQTVSTTLPDAVALMQSLGSFLGTQLLRLAPMALAAAWLLRARRTEAASAQRPAPADRRFLWIVGVGPLLLTVAYALATQTQLVARWGGNLFLLAGWLVVDLAAGRDWRGAMRVAVGLQLAIVIGVTAAGIVSQGKRLDGRAGFPGKELAAQADATWARHSSEPLRLVITDAWLGGNIVAHLGPVAVLVDGITIRAPWVTEQQLLACGALIVDDRSSPIREPGVVQYFPLARAQGEWRIGQQPGREGLRIGWGVIPPGNAGGCRL